jgi:hypothetical protein
MIRRLVLAAALSVAAFSSLSSGPALASEASAAPAPPSIDGPLSDLERMLIGQRLRRENFTIAGDIRRKGALIVAVAVQQGVPWRLVIEAQTGEIIGRRPLAETANWPR